MLQEQASDADADAEALKAGQVERPSPQRESPAPRPLATGEGGSQRRDKQTFHMVTTHCVARGEESPET